MTSLYDHVILENQFLFTSFPNLISRHKQPNTWRPLDFLIVILLKNYRVKIVRITTSYIKNIKTMSMCENSPENKNTEHSQFLKM